MNRLPSIVPSKKAHRHQRRGRGISGPYDEPETIGSRFESYLTWPPKAEVVGSHEMDQYPFKVLVLGSRKHCVIDY